MLRHRKCLKIFVAFGILVFALALLAWSFPTQILTVDSGPVKADVMVVLGGGTQDRPQRAAELFKEGVAPKIILTGKGDYQSKKRFLLSAGVPEDAIEVEPKATSTKENAEFTVLLLRAHGAKRVVIVTSWYHSRRALNCFEHYAPDIHFYSRPSYEGYSRHAPTAERKAQRAHIRSEYIKLLGYWVRYGICPL